MDYILPVAGTLILAFVITVLLRQSYNLLFFTANKLTLWIAFVTALPVAVWAASAALGWHVSVPLWACTLSFFFALPPSSPKEARQEILTLVDNAYTDMGVKRGRLLYRIGLIGFAVASVASWMVFYGEICSNTGCTKLIDRLF